VGFELARSFKAGTPEQKRAGRAEVDSLAVQTSSPQGRANAMDFSV
jgi:hypothetical protein